MQVFFDPSLLQSGRPIWDEEEKKDLTPDFIRSCYREYLPLIRTLRDIDLGRITFPLKEYQSRPAIVEDLLRLYRYEKEESTKE